MRTLVAIQVDLFKRPEHQWSSLSAHWTTRECFLDTVSSSPHSHAVPSLVVALQKSMLYSRCPVAVDITRLQETSVLVELREQLIHVNLSV